jgi:hypothetical protein
LTADDPMLWGSCTNAAPDLPQPGGNDPVTA